MSHSHTYDENFLRDAHTYKRRIDKALAWLDSDTTDAAVALRCILTGGSVGGNPCQVHATGPRGDEQPRSDPTDARPAPDAATGHQYNHHDRALTALATARQLAGSDAGTVEALTALTHAILAILAGQEKP